MPDEIIPADRYPDPYDTPLNELRSIEEPDHYEPPPRDSLPPTEQPMSAKKPPRDTRRDPIKLAAAAIPTPPNELKDRLTLSIQAHHERWGYNPKSFQIQFHDNSEISEQAYERQLRIGSDKKRMLTFDHPELPGLIMIANRTGNVQITRPTPQQAQALKQKVLYLSFCEDCPDEHALIVRPGRAFFGELQDDTEVWLKAASGICEIEVFIFPR